MAVVVAALVSAGDPTGVPLDFRGGLSAGAGADGVIVTLSLSKQNVLKEAAPPEDF